jgi:vacuolar-type H+-ATPase subunit E/Vma4
MTLERLVEEIRLRAEEELRAEQAKLDEERRRIETDRDRRVEELRAESTRSADAEAQRIRVQTVAAARLAARKLAYEAKERRMADALDQSRQLLRSYTQDPEYKEVLKRMIATAADELGKNVRISGRTEDASALKTLAGKGFDERAQPILGGIVAETPEGNRRLNLSFDELLRLREDRLRELLAK